MKTDLVWYPLNNVALDLLRGEFIVSCLEEREALLRVYLTYVHDDTYETHIDLQAAMLFKHIDEVIRLGSWVLSRRTSRGNTVYFTRKGNNINGVCLLRATTTQT
jgi:hypothetical protein